MTLRIGFFDSGVGGLSVLRYVKTYLEAEPALKTYPLEYYYLLDRAGFPYGTKPEDFLNKRIVSLARDFLTVYKLDYLVLACSTASTLSLDLLRQEFTLPIIGVVPAIKPAAAQSHTKCVALLATAATVRRPYTHDLIRRFAADCRVLCIGSEALVKIAEAKMTGQPYDFAEAAQDLAPLRSDTEIDTLIFACTHFPFLQDEILAYLQRPLLCLDPNLGVAKRLAALLQQSHPEYWDVESGASGSTDTKGTEIRPPTRDACLISTADLALSTELLVRWYHMFGFRRYVMGGP